jgi:hypothetical protein
LSREWRGQQRRERQEESDDSHNLGPVLLSRSLRGRWNCARRRNPRTDIVVPIRDLSTRREGNPAAASPQAIDTPRIDLRLAISLGDRARFRAALMR